MLKVRLGSQAVQGRRLAHAWNALKSGPCIAQVKGAGGAKTGAVMGTLREQFRHTALDRLKGSISPRSQ